MQIECRIGWRPSEDDDGESPVCYICQEGGASQPLRRDCAYRGTEMSYGYNTMQLNQKVQMRIGYNVFLGIQLVEETTPFIICVCTQ